MMCDNVFPSFIKAGDCEKASGGLTKREYFALEILLTKKYTSGHYIEESVEQADDLLEALAGTNTKTSQNNST